MKYALFAIALLTLAAFTGCADKGVILRTPYGIVDTTTSGTTNLDITPLFPPAKSYNLDQQLEK